MDITSIPVHGQLGPRACVLVERLRGGKPGDEITDAELESICGKPTGPGEDGYMSLCTAIRYTLKEFRVHWKRIAKQGLIRALNAHETCEDVGADMAGMRKRIRTTSRKIVAVDRSALSDQEAARLTSVAAQLSAINAFAAPSVAAKIEEKQIDREPNLSRLLEVFG